MKILRIGFEQVSFDFQAREILANAVGKFLLELARNKKFKKKPIVLFVDEAHQFLNKKVKLILMQTILKNKIQAYR